MTPKASFTTKTSASSGWIEKVSRGLYLSCTQNKCFSPRKKIRPLLIAGEAKHFSPNEFCATRSKESPGLITLTTPSSLNVGRRRARGLAVERVFFFEGRLEDDFLPEDPAGVALQAKQDALFAFGQAGDGEQFVFPNDWGRMAQAGYFRSPGYVARRGPMHRRLFFKAGAIAARSTPARPVFRPCFRTERGDGDERHQEPQPGLGGRGDNSHVILADQLPRPVFRSHADGQA